MPAASLRVRPLPLRTGLAVRWRTHRSSLRAEATLSDDPDTSDALRTGATLRDWVARWAAEKPDHPALLSPSGTITYAELHASAQWLAAGLRAAGIVRSQRVCAQLPNSPEFVTAYLASGYANCVFQTLHMPYRAAEIAPLLAHAQSAALIALSRAKGFEPAAYGLAARAHLPDLKLVVAVGDAVLEGAVAYDDLAATEGEIDTRPSPSDPYVLLYTSGTTSAPKGVMVAYENFLPNAARSAPELGVDGDSILLSAAPFTHLYGIFSINLALAAGATMALLPVYTPPALAEALATYRPTHLFSAPAHMAAAEANGLLTPGLLSSLKLLQISGSACPPALARTVQERLPNGKVGQLWGMSELQAGAFTRPGDPLEARIASAGRASPGTELRVVEGGVSCPAEIEGELQVRGPSLFSGYLDNAAASADAFTEDGWFRTGDLAVMDAAGFIRITGRSKDVINRGGVKFNPADVEDLLAGHPAFAQCAIVPVPDATLGERACLVAILRAGAEPPTLDDLRAFLTEAGVAKTKWPERLEFVDEMPMTPTRKVKKAELAKLMREREPG